MGLQARVLPAALPAGREGSIAAGCSTLKLCGYPWKFLQPAQGFCSVLAVDADLACAAGLADRTVNSGVHAGGRELQLAFAALRCIVRVQLDLELATEFSVVAAHIQR